MASPLSVSHADAFNSASAPAAASNEKLDSNLPKKILRASQLQLKLEAELKERQRNRFFREIVREKPKIEQPEEQKSASPDPALEEEDEPELVILQQRVEASKSRVLVINDSLPKKPNQERRKEQSVFDSPQLDLNCSSAVVLGFRLSLLTIPEESPISEEE